MRQCAFVLPLKSATLTIARPKSFVKIPARFLCLLCTFAHELTMSRVLCAALFRGEEQSSTGDFLLPTSNSGFRYIP
jgi:hypothetical protein